MSEREPVDPFSDINLDTFKNAAKSAASNTSRLLLEKEVREVAIQSNFRSRQPIAKREPHKAKTFSLFPEDTAIIKNAIRFFMDHHTSIQASGSDVVRAALHEFACKSENEQARLIEKHRARGKREYT